MGPRVLASPIGRVYKVSENNELGENELLLICIDLSLDLALQTRGIFKASRLEV